MKALGGLPSLAQTWALAKQAVSSWLDDYAPSMGAALSYYTVFSLAPMLLIVIAVAGLVFGQEAARGALFGQLNGLMGADGATAVEGLLASVSKPTHGIIATATGLAVLLIGATTVFGELQDALNRIWRVPKAKNTGGIWGLVRTRLLSFGMILGIAFLLMVSLVLSAGVSALGEWWSPFFGGWEVLAKVATFVFGLVVTTIGFGVIYKFMPNADVRWHDVWVGAAVTALLFSLGRFLIGFYIGTSGVASGFGAAGSIVLVFVWVYYSAQIFLLGAEFTWAYATSLGSMKDIATSNETSTSTSTSAQPPVSARSSSPAVPARSADGVGPAAPPVRVAVAAPSQAPASVTAPVVVAGLTLGALLRYGAPWLARRFWRR